MNWTEDIELLMRYIFENSVIMNELHKKRFLFFKGQLKYYRIPIIILSGFNSVLSVGLSKYVEQDLVSVITCMVSLICGIVGSIELFLSIQSNMEDELNVSKEYYLLAIDIQKVLTLSRDNRPPNAKEILEEKFQQYHKLFESSQIVDKKIKDRLAPLPRDFMTRDTLGSSSSSSSSSSTPKISVENFEMGRVLVSV
jgi:hypothetical protein